MSDSFPLKWPEPGWYEAGSVNHTENFKAIFSWCKFAKVDPNLVWALDIQPSDDKTVIVHTYALNEDGDKYLIETQWGLDVAHAEPFKVAL